MPALVAKPLRFPQEQQVHPIRWQQLRQQQQMQGQETDDLADPANETPEQAMAWLATNVDEHKTDAGKEALAKKSANDLLTLAKTSRAAMRSKRDNPYEVPEKFLKDGKPDYAAVTSSYKELERSQFKRREDLKKEIADEIAKQRPDGMPEAPGDYKEPEITLPNGTKVEYDREAPMFAWFRSLAHANKVTQQGYEKILKDYISLEAQRGPKWDVESKQLGEQAEERLDRIDAWAQRSMPNDFYKVFASMPATAMNVKMWEHVMELTGEAPFAVNDQGVVSDGPLTREQLQQMQKDPRYYNNTDAQFVAKVRAGFKRLAQQKRSGG